MDALKAQLADLEAQKESLLAQHTIDHAAVDSLNEQIKAVQGQLASAEIEDKVHADGVPFAVDGIDFTDLPAQVITLVEKIVKADRRRIYADHAAELQQLGSTHDASQSTAQAKIDELTKENASLQDDYNKCATENSQYVAEIAQLTRERDEARQNRDNAAAQLDEANKQIAQLKSQVDDYQKAKVFGEREAQSITDITPAEQDDILAAKEAVKKLYTSVEDWGSVQKVIKPDGTFELASREELKNDWVPETGVSGQDSFRNEDTSSIPESSGIPATEVAITPPPVPSFLDTTDAVNASGGNGAVQTVVAEQAISRAEFEELKERVAAIENGQVRGAA